MRPFAQAENKDAEHTPLSLFNYFVNRCRENLHIILAFSPIGDAFRNRMRMFPSLINCCTIDWFQAWPDKALGVCVILCVCVGVCMCVHVCVCVHVHIYLRDKVVWKIYVLCNGELHVRVSYFCYRAGGQSFP